MFFVKFLKVIKDEKPVRRTGFPPELTRPRSVRRIMVYLGRNLGVVAQTLSHERELVGKLNGLRANIYE